MMIFKNIRKEILKLSRSEFEIRTNFSQHTLRRIEENILEPSDKLKTELKNAFLMLGIEISEDFKTYSNVNTNSLDNEFHIDKRIDKMNKCMKKIHPSIYSIKLTDDKLGSLFKENSIVYGNKIYSQYDKYLNDYCIVMFKKSKGIRQKKAMLRKLKSIDKKFNKLVFEKIKGENTDLRIEIEKIDFICPIFCVRNYDDYQS